MFDPQHSACHWSTNPHITLHYILQRPSCPNNLGVTGVSKIRGDKALCLTGMLRRPLSPLTTDSTKQNSLKLALYGTQVTMQKAAKQYNLDSASTFYDFAVENWSDKFNYMLCFCNDSTFCHNANEFVTSNMPKLRGPPVE